jgi:putative hydrolase of the HAD superfamily
MKNKHFIYFDIGNTLVDCTYYFKTATKKFHLKEGDMKQVFNEYIEPVTTGQMDAQQFWKLCIQRYNIHNAENYNFLESWVSDYEPITEMHEVVNKLKSKYRIGLLSNIYKGMLPLLLEKGLIPNIPYDQVIFSCEVGMMKPHADIYDYAQKKAHTEPKNILLIDDKPDFIEGAKKAVWNTFMFNDKNRKNSAKELEDYIATLL